MFAKLPPICVLFSIFAASGDASRGSDAGDALGGRRPEGQAELVARYGGNEASQRAVASALLWLAKHQLPDGSWSFNHLLVPGCRGHCRNSGSLADARNAATGLALLPFLGAGQTHKEGEYKNTVRRGLYYLVNQMKVDANGGSLNETGGNMYSHGIGSIALCEAYAMTHDQGLLAPAQKTIDFVCYAQDPVGGGWRYQPRQKGDTSVTGWQIMAIKAGHAAYLQVPPASVKKACTFLDSVQAEDGANYGYTKPAAGRPGTTAIGLLCRIYLGWKKDNPALAKGVKLLSETGPSDGNDYYNYYATQVMFHWQGDAWNKWNDAMRDQLIDSQATDGHEEGSWGGAGSDMAASRGGRLYTTAMSALILETYYRYGRIYGKQEIDE
jgi:hypothetical protein